MFCNTLSFRQISFKTYFFEKNRLKVNNVSKKSISLQRFKKTT